ncbi:transmembrane protease serine 2 isoform X1 [Silurus meridionalis]|uniref:transmembrane protease serine 2 isoform X1 n=1 Tax=Silurus meridionalis TaxID=175797 RepID=UPI001EEA9573|nr:transmembrane protease serine 2 isoform X1 [Silurus meridionalis]
MYNNPSHVNYGFQYEEERPPPQAPEYPPPYYPSVPLYSNFPRTPALAPVQAPINTHYTVTAGLPYTPSTQKASRSRCLCITAAVVIIVLIILAVAAVLIWYFLFSACVMGRRCGQSSMCVRSWQWCNGQTDCPAGEDEAQCFRFYGSNLMLQSFSNKDQKWKAVCSDRWDNTIGKQVCQQIGYSSSDYVSYGTINPSLSSADGYMILKSDFSNAYSAESVHDSLSDSSSCPTNTAVTLKCIGCGSSLVPGVRIVGGVTVNTLGRWPWQVSLQAMGSHMCGGSIITPSWIVTAAHCVQTFSSPSQWKVFAGFLTLTQMSSSIGNSVIQVIAHPGYDPDNNNNDIALMKLWSPLRMSSNIAPVCLPNTGLDLSTSRTYYVTGWGATVNQGSASNELREAQVSLISRTVCNSRQVYNGIITDTMICAGTLDGGVDTCQGDSGGPLVTSENFLWWLVGDTSWGQGCALRNRPGVYGNVTTFVDWIYMQMKVRT